MSMNPLHTTLARNATSKPPLSVSNVNQNIDRRRLLTPKRMSKETGNDDFYQPPDKRRKTDEKDTSQFESPGDWGDDEFTQDQLENIDEMVFMSQQVAQQPVDGNHNTKKVESAPSSVRVLGKGTNRSQSAGDMRASVQGLPPVYPSSKQSGQQSQRKVTTTTGGGARLQATPTAGASGHGLSPGMPSSATYNTKEIDQLRSELDFYKKEVKKAREGHQSKEGHIKILKSKLDEKEKELHNQQQSRLAQLEQAKHERSEREKTLQKDLDRLTAQLQFKEQEIVELQGTCRRLEQKSHGSTGSSDSPRRQTSPRRPVPVSPRRSARNSPRAVNKIKEKSTPVSDGKGFPNKTSFMAEERRPSMRNVLSTTPEPSPSKTGVVSKPAEPPQREAVADLSRRVVKMKLDVTSISGMAPNATLVSKIVAENPNRLGGGRPRGEGLINLLHAPPLPREISGVKLRHQDETFTHSSDNRLMKLLKAKGSPKAPKKKIVIPQIVTPENYQLAVTGLTLMLETDQDDFDHQRASSVVSATSEHAVLILPVLDRYLVSYTFVLEKSLDLSAISAGATVRNSLTPAKGSSLDTLTSSLRSLLLRGANVANLVESSAINTLKVLYNLVRYSSQVRKALICDTYSDIEAKKPTNRKRKTKDTVAVGDSKKILIDGSIVSSISANQGTETSANHKLPAATRTSHLNPQPSTSKQALNTECAKQNSDKATSPLKGKVKGKASSSRSDKIASIVSRKLQIRRCLTKMANPCLPNNDPAKVEVVLLALKTLAIMADSCKTQDQFDRFGPLLTLDVLLNCLTESNKLPKPGYYLVVGSALDLLISLAKNIKLTKQMCTGDEETCLMVAVYSLHQIVGGMPDQALKSRITSKFVCFLSAISCRHRQSVNLLFDKNCKCSSEVVKSVIVTLHEEILRWRQNSSRVSTETLSQGATLLHALACQDKLFEKHKETVLQYYKELLYGLAKVITHAKHITPGNGSATYQRAVGL